VDWLAWLAAISGCVDVHPVFHQPAWAGLSQLWSRPPKFESNLGYEGAMPPERVGFCVRWIARLIPRPMHRSQTVCGTGSSPDPSNNDKIVAYVKDMGVDLVVVLRLVTPYGAWFGATDINVYGAKTNSEFPVWSGTTNTSNFSTAQEAATSVAASLLYGLINANVLVR
jgi:hypothetical protein